MTIRVAVVDDQSVLRMGLRVLLSTESDLELVGEAADGAQALRMIRQERPDVVLMDIRMPGMDGIEAIRRLAADAELAAVRVVVLTTFDLDEYVLDALSAGACGFVLKDAEPAELLRAVRVAAAGDALLSPQVTRTVIRRLAAHGGTSRPDPALSTLTERERQVVGLLAVGLSNDEIAARLVVSEATVRTHISRALAKTGARDRAQLVVRAYRGGLPIPEI
ncbi:MAG: response regulator transcription factor [Hamadaea sp.]|uniref:response regulator n=1 Tax=Hamadaea sp. TaxID=2024425 RepID=UPI001824537A|nr:response regulator transcription factor [Hamadaea sp.]NUT18762.1 response regulator transcription factor [Hamadaea sp.]